MDLPIFYKEMLLKQYGENTLKSIEEGLSKKRAVTLRINTIKTKKDEVIKALKNEKIEFKEVTWYEDAFIILNASEEKLQNLSIYEEGKVYLQSLSSMIPPLILNPKPKENILDMCSAPGGKTLEMVCLSENKAYITAVEKNKIRGEKLKYNLKKQQINTVNVMIEDARNLSDYLKFDKILLDAPCSGSGTDNVFKNNFTKELVEKSVKTQEVLLKKALRILKSGGEIIYSTCSILEEENENVIEKLLSKKNCKLEQITISDNIKTLPSKIKQTVTIAPNEFFEGFFVAKIIKD